MALTLHWEKGQDNKWGNLLNADFNDSRFSDSEGVYVVWHGGQDPEIVCVGKGNIQKKLQTLSLSKEVHPFQPMELYFAWAKVVAEDQAGIEVFLSQKLQPKLKSEAIEAEPVTVNMPWKKSQSVSV